MGSLCNSSSNYQDALARCAELFEYAVTIGYNFTLLDIGGGFPGQKGTDALFDKLSVGIAKALSLHFVSPRYPNLKIISEPGTIILCENLYNIMNCEFFLSLHLRDSQKVNLHYSIILYWLTSAAVRFPIINKTWAVLNAFKTRPMACFYTML